MMVSPDDCFDQASLESFVSQLVDAGFEPVENTDRRRWRARIHPAFSPLTGATSMDLVLVPGWPYQPPALLVAGLDTNHSTLDGLVCMWRDDDASLRWTTVDGLLGRIEEWCRDAVDGWDNDDLGRDAYLNFRRKSAIVATFDLAGLSTTIGGWGDFHGVVNPAPPRIDLRPGRAQSAVHLHGLWFSVGDLLTPPPRNLAELPRCLSRTQRRGLQREIDRRRVADRYRPSGGVDLVLFAWERGTRQDVLVMALEGTGGTVEATALQAGPNDEGTLLLRAGPDADVLRTKRVVVFGAGALGGHVAVTLAEAGVGVLDVVDRDVVVPGNVVRHVAGHDQVGATKVAAVAAAVRNHAPWTEVNVYEEAPETPMTINERIIDADVVIDATGNAIVTRALADISGSTNKALVSGALYRGGRIARVRRQAQSADTPIGLRSADSARYPTIPVGDDHLDIAVPDVGCSAPVNNAPPAVVLAGASLIAQAAIDVLTGRFELEDEFIDVYRALPGEPPFDRIGRVNPGAGA